MADSNGDWEFDIALSFASEDRAYVQSVAAILRERSVRVFYDEFFTVELWGADLYTVLAEVYRRRSRFTAVFVSHHYIAKPWTRHERQSAQARALISDAPYLLPIRLDNSELAGLRPTVGYITAPSNPAELADLICQKLGNAEQAGLPAPRVMRVPRTVDETRELLGRRPPGWEYLFFAGVIYEAREALEPKWRDYEIRYVQTTGALIGPSEVMSYVRSALSEIEGLAPNVERVLDARALASAFGPPGQPGDPRQIEHLGRRLVTIYDGFLDWSLRVRGAKVASGLRRTFDLLAAMADDPLHQMRAYFDRVIATCDDIPELLARPSGEPTVIEARLVIDIDRRRVKDFLEEVKRAQRAGLIK